jgi:hypothetical protein
MEATGKEFQVKGFTKWASGAQKIKLKDGSLESLDESDITMDAKAEKNIILNDISVWYICSPFKTLSLTYLAF